MQILRIRRFVVVVFVIVKIANTKALLFTLCFYFIFYFFDFLALLAYQSPIFCVSLYELCNCAAGRMRNLIYMAFIYIKFHMKIPPNTVKSAQKWYKMWR